ncbi:MAG: ABC transporter substrate-binding protein [Eubacteriaceae bacterium]
MFKNKVTRNFILVLIIFVLTFSMTACNTESAQKETIILANAGWASNELHNSIASFIIENGYEYDTDVISGGTPSSLTGIRNGDIDVMLELWTDNIMDAYQEALDNEEILKASTNFDDNAQGLYVPTYLIEGDEERGIEPLAPDLKSIKDLDKYWELFKDPEDPSKGRMYGAIPGWAADEVMQTKIENYGLDETYNYFSPGSAAALNTSLVSAFEKGEAWLGYNWEPTWVMGSYDMTLLEDEPYDQAKWEDGYQCEFPAVDVAVAINIDLPNKAPEIAEFLNNYETNSALTSEALSYMQDNEATTDETAIWFLKEHEEIWIKWVPEDIATKVKEAL